MLNRVGRLITTPLRAAFEIPQLSPSATRHVRTERDEETVTAENFARDVRIELMRNAVESLKTAEDLQSKIEIMGEMHRIMVEDSCTKDVFRELDGYILLVNTLAILQSSLEARREGPSLAVNGMSTDMLEGARLAFMLIAESFRGHRRNERFFEKHVGYATLGRALMPLIRDTRTVDHVLGFLLSLSLNNFALSSFFSTLRPNTQDGPCDATDNLDALDFSASSPLLGMLRYPRAFVLLVALLGELSPEDAHLPHVVYAVAEQLASGSHRNHALLACAGTSSGSCADPTNEFEVESDKLDAPLTSVLLQHLSPGSESDRGAGLSDRSNATSTRHASQRLIRRIIDMGLPNGEARKLFASAICGTRMAGSGKLDADVLDLLRAGMKSRWPPHFSLEGAASLAWLEEGARGLPPAGFTFMIWLRLEKLPPISKVLFMANAAHSRTLLQLLLRSDGGLEIVSAGNVEPALLQHARVSRARWTHLTIVHHPHRGTNPTIRVFMDGALVDSRNWMYPRPDSGVTGVTYTIGDDARSTSWCIASAYLLATPIADEMPRLIHHLGVRYNAHFQARDVVRELTYDAATSLNIHISGSASKRTTHLTQVEHSELLRAIRDGIGIPEQSFVFVMSPNGLVEEDASLDGAAECNQYIVNPVATTAGNGSSRPSAAAYGDVYVANVQCLDLALWKAGGTAVALHLIELASNPHELSRTVNIFADSIRMCWQMSEDAERLHAYESLAHILRGKAQLINVTMFEILFEFIGMNFKIPEQSTIINTLAYRALALDFELWVSTRPEIQRVHLDHFAILLKTSKYRQFNAKQRLSKFSVIRKLLFALQTEWYAQDMTPHLVTSIKVVAHACFSVDETVKPVVSYLAANLHDDPSAPPSPRSILSYMEKANSRANAEQVLGALSVVLSSPTHLAKFSAALPFTRVIVLLLGEHPSPAVAVHMLDVIRYAIKASASFIRKFELVSGWTALKAALPQAWDIHVQKAAFAVLFGLRDVQESNSHRSLSVTCPLIFPSILSALDHTLNASDQFNALVDHGSCTAELLLEELMEYLSTSASFRQLFKSQHTTAQLIDAYASFINTGSSASEHTPVFVRVLEKINHFVMSLTLDKSVSSPQKEELLHHFQRAENLLNRDSLEESLSSASSGNLSKNSAALVQASVQLLGERAYQKVIGRVREWRKAIISTERKRLHRTYLDLKEYRRKAESSTQWRNLLFDDRGIWAREVPLRSWILDETEGPCRVRKKLERRFDWTTDTIVLDTDGRRLISEPDMQSVVQVDVPPWAEGYEFSVTDSSSDHAWIDELAEDKHRRVRHELQPGDVIEAVCTVTRIVGVDSSPGLLILGRKHLYTLDGLVENEEGEIVNVHDAPRNLFSVPGSILELDGKQRAQNWSYEQISSFSRKTCLFRDVALEIYFKDNRSLLIVFPSKQRRQDLCNRLADNVASRSISESRSPLLLRTPLLGKTSAKLMVSSRDELMSAQRKWQAREISNFTYLSILNQSSGRTPLDATQYPIFPWVLADYSSNTLDLQSRSTFRDLGCPMGALTPQRREAAEARYENLKGVGETPFHYGTHFSSSMIVCHFLIRLEPFTHMFKTLQGGDWDLPDRLFSDVARSYYSASQDLRGDVRELIPEFYACPEFLVNSSNLDFGTQQISGEKIHNVGLPPWAKEDPFLFITEHRKALESDYVSERLSIWIDLVWGCNQRDAGSLNVFHPLSYEGSIDLDAISDVLEREATVGIIHNFGQTPRKLFDAPHPLRTMQGPTTLPLGTLHGIEEDFHLLLQASKPHSDIREPVASINLDMASERVLPCPANVLSVPQYPHEQVGWGYVDQSLRLIVDRKVVQVVEAVSCTCIAFADSENFVTGSTDTMLRQWRISRKDGSIKATPTRILRAHTDRVLCVAACRAWSLIVSASQDGTAAIWDLNRSVYIRTIRHSRTASGDKALGINLVAINESTGHIATCSSKTLTLHTINAHVIVELDLTVGHLSDGPITSLAFHEREYSRLGVLATGTSNGVIHLRTWTAADTPPGERAQWRFVTLRSLRCREDANGLVGKVTALQFVGETLYHGDSLGRLFSWDLPD